MIYGFARCILLLFITALPGFVYVHRHWVSSVCSTTCVFPSSLSSLHSPIAAYSLYFIGNWFLKLTTVLLTQQPDWFIQSFRLRVPVPWSSRPYILVTPLCRDLFQHFDHGSVGLCPSFLRTATPVRFMLVLDWRFSSFVRCTSGSLVDT